MANTPGDFDLRTLGDNANIANVDTVLRAIQLGTAMSRIKATFTGLASAAAQAVNTAAALAAAVVTGWQPSTTQVVLPPVGVVRAVRVTAGAAAAGVRFVGDAGATPSATVCVLSDDGTTLTFEAGVTGFVLEYYPLTQADLSATAQNQ